MPFRLEKLLSSVHDVSPSWKENGARLLVQSLDGLALGAEDGSTISVGFIEDILSVMMDLAAVGATVSTRLSVSPVGEGFSEGLHEEVGPGVGLLVSFRLREVIVVGPLVGDRLGGREPIVAAVGDRVGFRVCAAGLLVGTVSSEK